MKRALSLLTVLAIAGCISPILKASDSAALQNESEAKIVKRQYAPDRKVDIIHITIDVTPDFKARTISGTTTITFVPIAKPLSDIKLSALDLTISDVTSSSKISGFSVTDETITVTFAPPVVPGTETTVRIVHEAEPKRGLYFRTPQMGYREEDIHLFTQGETHYAPNWYPNYDYPNERFTSEVICHVPKDMTVLSNGKLISEDIDPQSGLKVARWLQDKPHVNYLIALVAGKFEKIESKYKDIPLAFYTPTSQIDQAQNSFKDTADMLAFFEREIGVPYPWNKYYQVVVDDFVSGGMENTTLTVLTHYTLFTTETENIHSSQMLVSHELVHQWFGDYVTCKDWSHIWLNEGFATYYALLYDEYKDGRDSMLYGLYENARGIISDEATSEKAIMHRTYENPREQFNWNRIYAKGGWIVHMLRTQLGEELYRQCIKTYLQRQAFTSVVTENLNSVIEELTGRSFDRFFDQWVFHAGHPKLEVSYDWSQKEKLAKVSIKQTQKLDDKVMLFHFPCKVRFIIGEDSIDRDIFIDSDQHDFYFPLEAEPNIVRFDPEYSLLADVSFEKPEAMLYAQLENKADVVGRLLAIEALKEKDDKKTIAELKGALNNDPFYGVRNEASAMLREIHTDEAFDALAESMAQPDARVRLQVVAGIGGFYRPESLELTKQVLKNEKNPAIIYEAICNLGRYHHEDTKQLLIQYLESKSYCNQLAEAALEAIRMLDDTFFIAPLQKVLSEREAEFASYGFADALDTLAHITRNEDDRTEVRIFLTGYVNHPKQDIKAGAIAALGTLGDPKAISIVETFSGDKPDDPIQRAAKDALEKLQEKKQVVPEEIIYLRETVDELKKDSEKLKDDLEDLKKRLDASEESTESDTEDKTDDDKE